MSSLQKADTLHYSVALGFGRAGQFQSTTAHADTFSVKRLMDIVCGSLALIVFLPIMAAIFLALLFNGGSPIFVHERVGRNGQLFNCYKFRSMVKDANRALTDYLERHPEAREEWNKSFKLLNDPRITWFGLMLRRTSMDELPQLFNVLKGDMSLVGPRPIVPNEIEYYADRIDSYYSCRPGITGLWQVSGRNLVSYQTRVRLDAIYARKKSLWFDTVILIRTVRVVLTV